MLLQRIITELDAELDRLQRLRSIVAQIPKPALALTETPEPLAPAGLPISPLQNPAPVQQPPAPVRDRGRQLVTGVVRRARRERPTEPTALTSAIPAGPVIVSPKDLAREMDQRAKARVTVIAAKQPDESANVEALSRDLTAKWLSGSPRLSA